MAFVTSIRARAVTGKRNNLCCSPRSPTRTVSRRSIVCSATAPPDGSVAHRLLQFFDEARDLGTIRFVCVSDGAVIETIGRFDYSAVYNDVRGGLLSLVSPDRLFELHVSTAKLAKITLSKERAKIGDHDIYVIRLKRPDEGIILSALLMWNPAEGPGIYVR
mmetsp:Transcript_6101/g.18436  ORF Transcript_6101/g.18436 Transcript_6101/m.18436 type:complete len:162 (+) Transcript_6101:121-606(+)